MAVVAPSVLISRFDILIVLKGEGWSTGKVAGRIMVKPISLPNYPVITG